MHCLSRAPKNISNVDIVPAVTFKCEANFVLLSFWEVAQVHNMYAYAHACGDLEWPSLSHGEGHD